MTLPDKLTSEYVSEYLESYCVPINEVEQLVSNLKISPLFQEIIKRYNNYSEMEELKNNYSDKITEYHKALTQSEQENKELKENQETFKERYSNLLNLKMLTGKDQQQDLNIVRSSILDTLSLINNFKSHYDSSPEFIRTWKEGNEILNSELGRMNDKLRQQYNKLRDAIKDKIELHKVWDDKQVVAVLESILNKVENEK